MTSTDSPDAGRPNTPSSRPRDPKRARTTASPVRQPNFDAEVEDMSQGLSQTHVVEADGATGVAEPDPLDVEPGPMTKERARAILGLGQDATLDDIKERYRKLARRFHPDKARGDTKATARFQRVAAAYRHLNEVFSGEQEDDDDEDMDDDEDYVPSGSEAEEADDDEESPEPSEEGDGESLGSRVTDDDEVEEGLGAGRASPLAVRVRGVLHWRRLLESEVLERRQFYAHERYEKARFDRLFAALTPTDPQYDLLRTMRTRLPFGKLDTVYEQTDYSAYINNNDDSGPPYNGCRRLGAYMAKGPASHQLRHEYRNSLLCGRVDDVDMVASIPNLIVQFFDHLDIPTIKSFVRDPAHYFKNMEHHTGLGKRWFKAILHATINGAGERYGLREKDWAEMHMDDRTRKAFSSCGITSLDELVQKLDTISWIKKVQTRERQLIYTDIEQRYRGYWEVCKAKARADGKRGEVAVGGTALSIFMMDVQNECLMSAVDKAMQGGLLGDELTAWVALIFDGGNLPPIPGDKDAALAAMVEAVKERVGVDVKLAIKPMTEDRLPGFDGGEGDVDGAAGVEAGKPVDQDTTKLGHKPVLGRHIRRLPKTHQELMDDAMGMVWRKKELEKELKEVEDEQQCITILAEIKALNEAQYAIFDELFVLLPSKILMAITNDRCIVVKYDRVARNDNNLAPLAEIIGAWKKDWETAPRYHKEVTVLEDGKGVIASDVFNSFCGLSIEQKEPLDKLEYVEHYRYGEGIDKPVYTSGYEDDVIRPMLEHVWMLVGGSKAHFELLLNDLADAVQNPHKRPTHAWIISGPQGTGKSLAMELLFSAIFGRDDPRANQFHGEKGLFLVNRDGFHLLRQKFNTLTMGRKAIVLDDVGKDSDLVKMAAALKHFITCVMRESEAKGENAVMMIEYAILFVLTNFIEGVVEMEDINQRRYIMVETVAQRQPESYFSYIIERCSGTEFRRAWFNFLMTRRLTGFNRYKPEVPLTDIMRLQCVKKRPPQASYLCERFLQHREHDPIVHCMAEGGVCNGNITGGKHPGRHTTEKPCPFNNRIPKAWHLSWTQETRVPKVAVSADYALWVRSKAHMGISLKTAGDFASHICELKKHGIATNKLPSSSEIKGSWIFQLGRVVQTQKTSKGRNAETTGEEKVRNKNCYLFPPILTMQKAMVKAGWMLPTDVARGEAEPEDREEDN